MSENPAQSYPSGGRETEMAPVVGEVDISKPGQGYPQPPKSTYVPPGQGFGDGASGAPGSENEWETGMITAPCKDCCFCLGSCAGTIFCAYAQREALLLSDFQQYTCFGGMCGQCSCCVCHGFEKCCMGTEVFCCPWCAVFANRFMVLQHYGLQESLVNTVVIAAACFLPLLLLLWDPRFVPGAWLALQEMILGCLLTQQQHQMRVQGYPRRVEMV
ncbi:uncharacterized protein TEOVI_000211700 [Trypanosoma equiperdum]|uniref:Uncharacterized protein n=3 Tax=Trypanozoon TaxID=39700 RepID=Q587E8_TRYB2|nr:hypothetical protein Tb927.2.3340 [Trypanosoma brucei brucei TREU927]AAQ15791.1 hypothetical protein Tb927.2.3340 [Trypanosoma brucei brucei TREU927]AAX78916.1 hypothetical protein Tb927.2.3340 [Trypanosoma brucei]RHW74156.1 hypothetical protein DPX39_020012100 [Trypanosoma brucei equiperdum]SCU70543.1 hypothetical protein, conserved [Trypanosoma equiperdum]